jgi:hypothetical protein
MVGRGRLRGSVRNKREEKGTLKRKRCVKKTQNKRGNKVNNEGTLMSLRVKEGGRVKKRGEKLSKRETGGKSRWAGASR